MAESGNEPGFGLQLSGFGRAVTSRFFRFDLPGEARGPQFETRRLKPVSNPSFNPDSFLPAMSAVAQEAGALLMRHFTQHLKIEYKGDADLVTAADRASEVLIRDRIRGTGRRRRDSLGLPRTHD